MDHETRLILVWQTIVGAAGVAIVCWVIILRGAYDCRKILKAIAKEKKNCNVIVTDNNDDYDHDRIAKAVLLLASRCWIGDRKHRDLSLKLLKDIQDSEEGKIS